MIRSIQTLVYRWRIILHDMMLTPMAWVGAYWLRFNLETVPDIFMHSAIACLLYTSPSPRDGLLSRMPSSA